MLMGKLSSEIVQGKRKGITMDLVNFVNILCSFPKIQVAV